MFKQFIAKEKAYFNKPHDNAQKLLITIFLDNLIGPLFGIFINAFLWRRTHDIVLVALYNLIVYAVIPLGFYINGYILRRNTPTMPYTVSLIINGLAVAALMFLPNVSYLAVIIFSIFDGFSAGIYWANRNLLTLKTTTTHDRIYFSSVETSSNTITSVIIPLVIGWFITFGTVIHLYTPVQGYQLLVVYMLVVIARIGIISKSINTGTIEVPVLLLKNISSNWKKFRWIQFIYGIENGVAFIVPVLLVLILVGNEAALGLVQSISAILASVLIYFLGRALTIHHRMQLIALSIVLNIIGSFFLGIVYSAIGVFIYFALQTLSQQFIWVGGSSINYDLIDIDNKDPKKHYAYVSDQEIYLNGGRVFGILLFIIMTTLISNTFALRFALIFVGSTQIFLLFIYHTVDKGLKKQPATV